MTCILAPSLQWSLPAFLGVLLFPQPVTAVCRKTPHLDGACSCESITCLLAEEGVENESILCVCLFFIANFLKWVCHKAHFSPVEWTRLFPGFAEPSGTAVTSSLCLVYYSKQAEFTGQNWLQWPIWDAFIPSSLRYTRYSLKICFKISKSHILKKFSRCGRMMLCKPHTLMTLHWLLSYGTLFP